jgi:GNAT superfamily N-acetyltransferase
VLLWEISASPSKADETFVSDRVLAFGRSLAVDGNAQPLACFVREEGTVVAGGVGRTEYSRLFVSSLWVTERLRCQGIGAAILARMESEALTRLCNDALIETLNDRVARMYQRLGYKPLATVPGYVGPFSRHVLIKRLRPPPPARDA